MILITGEVVEVGVSLIRSFLRIQGCLINSKLQIFLNFIGAINFFFRSWDLWSHLTFIFFWHSFEIGVLELVRHQGEFNLSLGGAKLEDPTKDLKQKFLLLSQCSWPCLCLDLAQFASAIRWQRLRSRCWRGVWWSLARVFLQLGRVLTMAIVFNGCKDLKSPHMTSTLERLRSLQPKPLPNLWTTLFHFFPCPKSTSSHFHHSLFNPPKLHLM